MLKRLLLYICLIGLASCRSGNESEMFEPTVKKFEEEDKAIGIRKGSVLFIGSSTIALWTTLSRDFPGVPIVNRGMGGSQFKDAAYYAGRIIFPYTPSKIFIYDGDNDLASGMRVDEVLDQAIGLGELIAKKLPDVPVFFISVKPSIARWEMRKKAIEFNKKLREYASVTQRTGFVDVWTPALDKNGNVQSDIFVEDNLHLNEKGYRIWQQVLSPYVTVR